MVAKLRIFKTINKVTNGRFSTLRNLDLIPESSSLENDIDLLIPSVYVKQVVEAVKSSSYQIYQDNSPCLYGAHPHIHFKHSTLDVHFDIMTGMYYRSVANNTAFVNIDKRLIKCKRLIGTEKKRKKVKTVVREAKRETEDRFGTKLV